MAETDMAKSTMNLKLLIDNHGKRVLFAEAGKDFVDFLFHILSTPVGTVIGLLRKQEMTGSLANLYQSIENLNDSYIQPNKTKDTFLKPMPPSSDSSLPLLALHGKAQPTVKKVYVCGTYGCKSSYSDESGVVCPNCRGKMQTTLPHVPPPPPPAAAADSEGGFVKGVVTYMIMDDLVVTPLSTISCITLLNKFNVKDVGALEEKVVHLSADEAVKLLGASLQSKKVLTDVFLKGIKGKSEDPYNSDC